MSKTRLLIPICKWKHTNIQDSSFGVSNCHLLQPGDGCWFFCVSIHPQRTDNSISDSFDMYRISSVNH